MKTKLMILILIGVSLSSCTQGGVSPGLKGPEGPLGPASEDLMSSSDAIVIEDTGEFVLRDYPLQGFSEVEVGGFFTAEVHQGDEFSVSVEAEEALMPYIEMDIQGETLRVGLDPDYLYSMEKSSHRVVITLPVLTQVHAKGHSMLEFLRFVSDRPLRIDVTEFSELIGTIETDAIDVVVADHSSLVLHGSVSSVRGEASNHSTVDLGQLDAGQIDVDADRFSTVKQ